jgi:hypothetical protein
MLPSREQWRKWSLPSKYSLVGLALGILGLGIGIVPLLPNTKTAPLVNSGESAPSNDFQRLVIAARSELFYASRCLSSYKLLYWQNDAQVCPPPDLNRTAELIDRYHGILEVNTYGEMWALDEIPREIRARSLAYSRIRSPEAMRTLENDGGYTLKDIWFKAQFLNWYLCWHDERFEDSQCSNLPVRPVDDTLMGPDWEQMPSKSCLINGFADHLGCLD